MTPAPIPQVVHHLTGSRIRPQELRYQHLIDLVHYCLHGHFMVKVISIAPLNSCSNFTWKGITTNCLDAALERQIAETSNVCASPFLQMETLAAYQKRSLDWVQKLCERVGCCGMQRLANNEGLPLLTMQAVMLYLTISATLCALCTVTTVRFIPGAATRGAVAAPTVRFRLTAVDRESPSAKSLICMTADCS